MTIVYDKLHELAGGYLKRERRDHTLQATALVHEAYMKLVGQKRVDWQGRTHFMAVAAQAMQRVLIDHARGRHADKRGGQWRRISLNDEHHLSADQAIDLQALYEALQRMRQLDERQTHVMELRLFGGLSCEEIAAILGVSKRTAERDCQMGEAWLRRELARRV